ncbi:Protein N-methyltransferase nnt1 [Sphaceloma murrayae]|uniref:Protein N-methyltransferase nnt1 n=1 Tax=Sphaceloma murrayae TaxID=2082308 RepID=A0A2K1QNE3_9PEZI|nr:Protein N-methyltransferase nnt1 [Sphaceloma murrayae]
MSDDEGGLGLFQEPDGYYEAEKPASYADHQFADGRRMKGHHLWNAGIVVSQHIEQHGATLIKGKSVLELGAGAGLPSITAALNGASLVVVTDYPDAELIDNLDINVLEAKALDDGINLQARGLLWGADVSQVKSLLQPVGEVGFDVLVLADLLFNHSEHEKLVATVKETLKHSTKARALVFFTPYRPWLLEKDLAFFDLARQSGFSVTKTMEHVMDKVMFEEDPGDEMLRRTVFGYELAWA